jgi:hypothetical protein
LQLRNAQTERPGEGVRALAPGAAGLARQLRLVTHQLGRVCGPVVRSSTGTVWHRAERAAPALTLVAEVVRGAVGAALRSSAASSRRGPTTK